MVFRERRRSHVHLTADVRHRIAFFIRLLMFGGAGLAAAADLSDEQMLARAKVCAQPFCSSSPEGCDFKIRRLGEEWRVTADPIERSENEKRVYRFHSDCTFVFTLSGAPTAEIQWPWLDSATGCSGAPKPTARCAPLQ